MQCFKKRKRKTLKINKQEKKTKMAISSLCKHCQLETTINSNDNRHLGEIVFELIVNNNNNNIKNRQREQQQRIFLFIKSLLKSKLVHANQIKNFLNQTLLHIYSNENNLGGSILLLDSGANCLLEDNYRQTPLIIAAKKNYCVLLELFCKSILHESLSDIFGQVSKAAYYACSAGNYEALLFLFAKFHLKAENLSLKNDNEPNALHIACYKSDYKIVKLLLKHLESKNSLNKPINRFRESTSLEETFKGFIELSFKYDFQYYFSNDYSDQDSFKLTINLLIENGAKFSSKFLQNGGLVKLISHIFTDSQKHNNFVHFLNCCLFLFKFNVKELFCYSKKDECKFEASLQEFLSEIYSILTTKLLKDFKSISFSLFYQIVFCLYESNYLKNFKYFTKLKESAASSPAKNSKDKFYCSLICEPLCLKRICIVKLKHSIFNFGFSKVAQLDIPDNLKDDFFISNKLCKDYFQELYFFDLSNESKDDSQHHVNEA
jgi:ankyrin repeat protein